jgi:ribosomal protein S2
VKKTCYDLEEKVKHETRVSKKLSKKTKSRLVRFFKKYKTLGYLSGNPRLIISLFPIKNPLFFKEVRLQNIPVISLGPQSVNKSTTQTVDYPVPLINNSDFLGNFLIRLLLLEAKKGHRSYILKFRVRKLSNFERFTFLQKVKSLPKF